MAINVVHRPSQAGLGYASYIGGQGDYNRWASEQARLLAQQQLDQLNRDRAAAMGQQQMGIGLMQDQARLQFQQDQAGAQIDQNQQNLDLRRELGHLGYAERMDYAQQYGANQMAAARFQAEQQRRLQEMRGQQDLDQQRQKWELDNPLNPEGQRLEANFNREEAAVKSDQTLSPRQQETAIADIARRRELANVDQYRQPVSKFPEGQREGDFWTEPASGLILARDKDGKVSVLHDPNEAHQKSLESRAKRMQTYFDAAIKRQQEAYKGSQQYDERGMEIPLPPFVPDMQAAQAEVQQMMQTESMLMPDPSQGAGPGQQQPSQAQPPPLAFQELEQRLRSITQQYPDFASAPASVQAEALRLFRARKLLQTGQSGWHME